MSTFSSPCPNHLSVSPVCAFTSTLRKPPGYELVVFPKGAQIALRSKRVIFISVPTGPWPGPGWGQVLEHFGKMND